MKIPAGATIARQRVGQAVWIVLAMISGFAQAQPATSDALLLPAVALTANELAVVVNDADPDSIEIGAYYAQAREIPPERVIHVRIATGRPNMTRDEFQAVRALLAAQVPPQVQAYALAWKQPYRVDCMSITAAFAFGFDAAYCAESCKLTKASPYYNSDSIAPQRELGMRPAMMLAAADVASAKALIDRGVRSDGHWPAGTGYLMSTSDRHRNVRSASYPRVKQLLSSAYPLQVVESDVLKHKQDVMFYFTGLQRVAELASNHFTDGALADHLTSAGGMLTDSPQMSALEWIQAGATGSYGTAFEPCNYWQKFPDIPVVMGRYLSGETLIEAYWKSVQMPGQGVFVGEPLASPFGGTRVTAVGGDRLFRTRALRPGPYLLQAADNLGGPFKTIGQVVVKAYDVREMRLPAQPPRVYRLLPVARPSKPASTS